MFMLQMTIKLPTESSAVMNGSETDFISIDLKSVSSETDQLLPSELHESCTNNARQLYGNSRAADYETVFIPRPALLIENMAL